jgi:hypothetical protein
MPEIISTPNALVQTSNGKRFYVFSGEITVSGETTMLDIDNIGERDIRINLEIGFDQQTSNNPTLRVKSNGIVVYVNESGATGGNYQLGYNELKLILPANTSLQVTLENSGSQPATVAGYGKFLRMD